jgi:hypothetical protein
MLRGPMRVSTLQLRSLAAVLVVLWAAAAVVMLRAYRPEGPFDPVAAAAAFVPALVAAAAVAYPPRARDQTAFRVALGLGIGSALLLVPTIAGLVPDEVPDAPRRLLPSPEVAYALLVALVGTSLLAGLGLAGAVSGEADFRLRGLVVAGAIAALLTGVASAAFGAAVANAPAPAEPGASAWGPTGPGLDPPACHGQLDVGPSARVEISARGRVDAVPVGTISVTGAREGSDERWQATRSTYRGEGASAFVRVGGRAWVRRDGGGWQPADRARATMEMLDRSVVQAALGSDRRVASEDLGVELVGGAQARHCRLATDGPTALAAFPALRWFLGQDPLPAGPALEDWRGVLDWWVFADGQLGMASVAIHGPAYEGDWPARGFQVTLEAQLKALDRAVPQAVDPPVQGG